mgnify:FL=1
MMPEPYASSSDANAGRRETGPLQEQVQDAMDRCVTPAVGRVVGQVEAALDDGGAAVQHQAQRLAEAVREQPLASIGIAALAGFVVARLMAR